MTEKSISNSLIKRLVKDISDIIKTPLEDEGIYYKHDDENIKEGYAMIIGPENTPYQYGSYFFKFIYPDNYPYLPPKVLFLTNKANVRFNPNLYRNGKCCLSLLNTWSGEQWSSCQSIRTILLNLLLLFNNKPLLNEPGILESHRDFETYNTVLNYYNIDACIYDLISNNIQENSEFKKIYKMFKLIVEKNYIKNKKKIIESVKHWKYSNDIKYTISLYKMEGTCKFSELYKKVQKLN